ncbi:transposase [Streptomyces sp. NPDC054866]
MEQSRACSRRLGLQRRPTPPREGPSHVGQTVSRPRHPWLSNGQWAVLEPLLPVVVLDRPSWRRRKLIYGIHWRVRTGASPWRGIPPEYGPWQTADDSSRR